MKETEKNENIFVVPHYIGSLKYFDKLYDPLKKNNVEIIYIIRNKEMLEYCKKNNKKFNYLTINPYSKVLNLAYPIILKNFRERVLNLAKKFQPKLIIQSNDISDYNAIIVKVAESLNIKTMVLQWAITAPELLYFRKSKLKNRKIYKKKGFLRYLTQKFMKSIKKIQFPIYKILRVDSSYKPSLGQGDSDSLGVINRYSKELFIRQGIDEEKIKILGHLDYDDVLKIKNKSKEKIKKKYKISDKERYITYFSQPFYTKDINYLKLEEQIDYIKNIIKKIEDFYQELNISYLIFIKIHPAEQRRDYKEIEDLNNIRLFKNANFNELIYFSDFCISQNSSVLQSAIVLKKPIIALNTLNLIEIKIGAKILGIRKLAETWEEFREFLLLIENDGYQKEEFFDYDKVLADGKCYKRTIELVMDLISETNKSKKNLK